MLAGEILAAAMVTPRETPPAFPGGRRADTPRARQGSGPPELEGVPAQHSRPPHSAPLCCAQAALPDGPGCPLAAAPAPSGCPHCRQPRGHLEAPPSQPGLSQTPTDAWDFSSGLRVSGPLFGGLAARGCIHPARHARLPASTGPLGGVVGSESWLHPLVGHRAEPQWGPGGPCWMNERADT